MEEISVKFINDPEVEYFFSFSDLPDLLMDGKKISLITETDTGAVIYMNPDVWTKN